MPASLPFSQPGDRFKGNLHTHTTHCYLCVEVVDMACQSAWTNPHLLA